MKIIKKYNKVVFFLFVFFFFLSFTTLKTEFCAKFLLFSCM